jgi:long-chain acyl-CoA synthetase
MNEDFWQTKQLAEKFGNSTALICAHAIDNTEACVEHISYQQLHHLVQQAKISLLAILVDQKSLEQQSNKQLVMLVAHQSINSIVYYLAALQLEFVVWWLDKNITADNKQKLIDLYQVNLLVDYGEITSLSSNNHELHQDLALLITTSGSTGSPNLIKLSYQNLQSNCQAICNTLKLQSTDTVITTLPLHYSFGLSVVNTHLNQGTALVLNEYSLLTRDFWLLFKQCDIRCLYGVPYHYQMLLKLKLNRLSLDSLRFFAVAGGRLLPDQVSEINNWCLDNNKHFFVMYGQTEATARISVLAPEKVASKPYAIGQAIFGGKLWLEGDELCYSGPNVMMGIAKNISGLSLPVQKQVLHTGDLALCDDDGDYQIIGRLKRFIKIIGQRINLDEVEQFFHERKLTVVCSGQDDLISCYMVKSSVTSEYSPDISQKLLSQFLNIHSSYCQCILIDKIPYSSSGKINYPALTSLNEDQEKGTS